MTFEEITLIERNLIWQTNESINIAAGLGVWNVYWKSPTQRRQWAKAYGYPYYLLATVLNQDNKNKQIHIQEFPKRCYSFISSDWTRCGFSTQGWNKTRSIDKEQNKYAICL